GRARAVGEPMRVWLVVEDPKLQLHRWERLCAPFNGAWDHLALRQEVPFSLYLPSLTDKRFPSIGRRDLRALLLVSSPKPDEGARLPPFDVVTTVENLRAAIGPDIPLDVLAAVDGAVGPPTLDALAERVTASRYTLLHLVCHGEFDHDQSFLYLTGT